jgi:hypothetical protein
VVARGRPRAGNVSRETAVYSGCRFSVRRSAGVCVRAGSCSGSCMGSVDQAGTALALGSTERRCRRRGCGRAGGSTLEIVVSPPTRVRHTRRRDPLAPSVFPARPMTSGGRPIRPGGRTAADDAREAGGSPAGSPPNTRAPAWANHTACELTTCSVRLASAYRPTLGENGPRPGTRPIGTSPLRQEGDATSRTARRNAITYGPRPGAQTTICAW